eukprot:50797_1
MQRKQHVNICILFGTECSGKSTIFQNLQILRNGALLESKDKYLNSIRQECVSTIIYLLSAINHKSYIKLLNSLSLNNTLELNQIARTISEIWNKYNGFHNIITHLYAYQNEFDFNDNIEYFINNINRIMSNDTDEKNQSILNNEDIIKFHCKNTSIPSYHYVYTERNQWENHFEIIDFDIPMKTIHYLADHIHYGNEALIYVCA